MREKKGKVSLLSMKEVLLIGSLLITPSCICLWDPWVTLILNHDALSEDFPKTLHQQQPLESQPPKMALMVMHLQPLFSVGRVRSCCE